LVRRAGGSDVQERRRGGGCRGLVHRRSGRQARITEIKIDTVEPFADGQPFGDAGSYERVTGIARGELDPQSPQNQPIADLDKAPRNARPGRI
jgi:hypothetical protein